MNLSQILIEVFKTILQEETLYSKKKKVYGFAKTSCMVTSH